ncbi:COG2220 Predicted Zn-dependent hydrolases of the beta-lactamase fold [Microbacteriaceae bacterium]
MKITKRGHACLELEHDGKKALIDPGFYTEDVSGLKGVVALVITHSHDDHCSETQVSEIVKSNPGIKIFGTSEVAAKLSGFDVTTVYHGDFYLEQGFSFEFFGDMHQIIHESIPLIQNTAVLVNNQLYYPGDSYTTPEAPVEILACPTSAPWLKIGDVMDFVAAVKPKQSFATHNALLSDLGHDLNNGRVKLVTEQFGGEFTYLKVGDSLEA